MRGEKMLKKFKVKIYVEKIVYAKDESEAYEIFWNEVENQPQQDLASFIDEHTTIKEI